MLVPMVPFSFSFCDMMSPFVTTTSATQQDLRREKTANVVITCLASTDQ